MIMNISPSMIDKACNLVENAAGKTLPFEQGGITINRKLIEVTIETLAEAPDQTLAQNCRNDTCERTPDGLDRRIKEKLNSDTRTANIISDVLALAGIVSVVKVTNPETGRKVKATRLEEEQHWKVDESKILALVGAIKVKAPTGTKSARPKLSRAEYLKSNYVHQFADWLATRLDQPDSFKHSYFLESADLEWSCSSLYDAYQKYWWPFKFECHVLGRQVSGSEGLSSSLDYLTELAAIFRPAVENNDVETTINCALSALEWGGVLGKNRARVVAMGRDICGSLAYISEKLNMDSVRLGENQDIHINSGFTKIYSLLVDDFIMYDGRVGAALGLLGRLFCQEAGLAQIPQEIEFSYGRSQEAPGGMTGPNRRNPSTAAYRLPEFTGDRQRHLDDNIKAGWLLKNLADKANSKFNELPQAPPLNERLTALQSALFMIGYDVLGDK
jgi:hypothetical protein